MCSIEVRLRNLNDIKNFVKDAESFEEDVNVRVGKFELSAKSIMNIFTLDLKRVIEVIYDGKNVSRFYSTMNNYADE